MTDYFNLLPSEISGLVLGFLRDSNCVVAAGAFLRENIHLSEFRHHYASVNEIPLYFRELTLLDIVHDYIHIVNEGSNSTSGLGAGTVCSLDNKSSGLRANRPVLRIYRQPVAANKANVFNFDLYSSGLPKSSSHQTPQSNIVASKSNADPMQSMVHLQNKTKRLSETLLTTTVISNSNSDALSPSTSCNSVIVQQSPISTTIASEETMNDANVQSIGVINQNENITSQQICLNAQSNDISDHQQISDNGSIFSVFSLLPPPASSETLVTDMVIYPVITCEDNLSDAKSTDLVSTKRRRNQPPRQLSPGSGVGSTIFSLTNSYEEELDMERFLSALFNNAEQVATRINAEVGILTRNSLSYNENSNRCDWPETTNTYEISQPVTTNASSSSSSSSSLSSTGVKLSTSFVCQDFNSDTSDNMQLWNDWFGIKDDLETCIDHLLSDLESIEVFTSTVNTTTVTYTTSTVSSTIPNQDINNTTIIETLIDTDQCSHQSSAVTTLSNDIVTSCPSNVSHELISSPSSSLSDCVTNVTINDKTLTRSITSATITDTSDLFHPNSPILSLSTLLCNNTETNSNNDNVNSSDCESLIIPNIPDTKLMMKTPIVSTSTIITTTSTVTNQHLVHNDCKRLITSSSSPFCFSQLVNNNNSQNFPSKRQCIRHSDDINNINNSTVNNNNTTNNLPPILITPDSKKNHANEHNNELFYENLPSCKLFKGNTNKDSFQHHSNDHPHPLQPTYLLSSSPSCYYSIPQNSNTRTIINNATNTCMTAYLLNNPLSIIDLRQITQSNNSTGIAITNENHYTNPITLYTTNNHHKLLSSSSSAAVAMGNHVNYVDLNNNSLINLIPISYHSNISPFIMSNTIMNTTLSTITMTTDSSNITSTAYVNFTCNTVSTCTTTTTTTTATSSSNSSNNTGSTTDVVVTTAVITTTGISDDYIQTIKKSLLMDAKENHPPTPALIVQSQPVTTNASSSSSSSSSLSSTGVKLSTSFVCQDFNSDTSDNMQLWNDWFGVSLKLSLFLS
ncbi:hypothetical protein Smp_143960.1 [Schistosoma mansoni]|uniref:hypothetical protein n=1 Tax=Schistosoma mansoni TaxID=6183 RepID=UPI0001A63057|nr:hypothetical protein Smp_143960.1 [Schistosoma mansoni]|eukprot:XP_018652784.1 hypothetical protein Smp_143960.1 [Schistosoma mansoni]